MIDPQKIWSSPDLPSLPSVAVELLELSNDPESEIADYVRLIRMDPAISARLVKAANSSYFGYTSKVSSIEGAIPLLGTTLVTSLALSFSLVIDSQGAVVDKAHYTKFWSRSLLQAVTAEHLARKFRKHPPGEFFLAGLLADIGVLAQLRAIPNEYLPILDKCSEENLALTSIENEELGFDHREIGAQLMSQWNMPAVLVEACRRHHDTLEQLQELPDQRTATLMRYVRIATSTGDFLTRNGDVEVRQELEELAKIFLGCRVRELDDLLDEARDSTDDAASLMSIDTAQLPRPAEMLSRANAQLAEIAIRARAEQTRASEATQQLADQKEELQRQNNRLQEASETDGLTGLFNRRAFDHRYEETISRCINTGQSAGVIFTDIDNFKQINDNYGHPFGDAVLQRIGKILLEAVRQSDFVARYGGEEFVIVAANCPPHVVDIIAERIRSKVDAETFACDDRPVHVTVSVGGSVLSVPTDDVPRHPSIAQSMLKQADQAMYDCKRSGRNRVKICKCDEPSELTA